MTVEKLNQATAITMPSSNEDAIPSALTWKDMLVLRAGELIIGSIFLAFVSTWKVLAWLLATWFVNIGLFAYRLHLKPASYNVAQIRIIKILCAIDAVIAGSAGYLLHVEGNLGMQAILYACLVIVAVCWIIERPLSSIWGGIGCIIIMLPAPIVTASKAPALNFFDLVVVVGLGCVASVLWLYAIKQEKNIREQIRLKELAQRSQAALIAANETKNQFFAAASHDLRQPVHAMGLYIASALARDVSAEDKRILLGLQQSWRVLDELLLKILDLSRIDHLAGSNRFSGIQLKDFLHSIIYSFHPIAEAKGVRLILLCKDNAAVFGDSYMMRRVISNLVDNAIKFSTEESQVAVVVRNRGDQWAIQIRDNGMGIAQNDQSLIFQEFAQVSNPERRRESGFGLGLAVAQRFSQAMNGKLTLRSDLGRGSCFTVELPKYIPSAISHHTDAGPSKLVETTEQDLGWLRQCLVDNKKSILWVEDDDMVRQATRELMSQWRLPCLFAQDAAQALRICQTASVAIALCDIRLPGSINGIDLAGLLKKQTIPALLISGESQASIESMTDHSSYKILRKPVDEATLVKELNALLGL